MDFLSKRPFFSLLPPRFLGKDARPFAHGLTHCFLIRTALRADGHAPAHRALSEFAIPAFTLHLHTYPIDIQMLTRELHPHFLLHRGEGKGGEAFTLITLLSNNLHATGEEVKAKNEKRRTRPRARKTPKRQLDCTSILGVRYLGCATRTTRSKD